MSKLASITSVQADLLKSLAVLDLHHGKLQPEMLVRITVFEHRRGIVSKYFAPVSTLSIEQREIVLPDNKRVAARSAIAKKGAVAWQWTAVRRLQSFGLLSQLECGHEGNPRGVLDYCEMRMPAIEWLWAKQQADRKRKHDQWMCFSDYVALRELYRQCIACGCMQHRACYSKEAGPCAWHTEDPPLCTVCAAKDRVR